MTTITIGTTMVRQSVEIYRNFATSNFVITSVIYTVFMLQGQRIVFELSECRIKYFVINEFLYNGSKLELGRTRDPFRIKILFRYKRVIYKTNFYCICIPLSMLSVCFLCIRRLHVIKVLLAEVLLAEVLLAEVLLADEVLLAEVLLVEVLLAEVLLAEVLLAEVLLAAHLCFWAVTGHS